MDYDKLGRVTDQKVNKGTTQVARQQLTYFGNDDPKTLITSFGSTAKPTQTFGYDYQHQLKTITGNANYFGATYAYNVAGRFSQAQETQVTPFPLGTEVKPRNVNYNYAGADPEQVTSLTNVSGGATLESYTYDPSGNQLTRTEPGTGLSWTYLYDGENQLRRATKKQGATVLGSEEYWYDVGGNRTHLVKRDAAGAKTETTWFLDGTEAHYAANNTVSHVYSYISLGTPVARTDRIDDTTITTEYQFHGLAGSSLAAVDKGGAINATFNYAPFGEVIETTDAGAHKRRFNDKQQDDLTTLTYYGARYYDKLLMGWTQADPLYLRVPDLGKQSTPRRSNLAVFSLNNPVRYVDPDGRDSASGNLPSMSGHPVAPSEAFETDIISRQSGDGGYVQNDCAHFSGRCQYRVFGGGGAFSRPVPVCGGGRGFCEGEIPLPEGTVGDISPWKPQRSAGEDNSGGGPTGPPPPWGWMGDLLFGVDDPDSGLPPYHIIFQLGTMMFGGAAAAPALESGAESVAGYSILNGVRRAKAAEIAGQMTVEADILVGNRVVGTRQIPITDLWSPKAVIDTSGSGLSRWLDTLGQTMGGSKAPPISVTPGVKAGHTLILDVEVL